MEKLFVVTGGAGFIGSNLVAELNRRGEKNIVVVDNLNSEDKKINLASLKYLEYADKQDFRKTFLSGKLNNVATIFHLGACSSTTQTDEDYLLDNNFLYTRQLCEWCLKNNSRFIYASSAATYGDGSLGYSDTDDVTPALAPLNAYGKSKQMFDMWTLENSVLHRIAGIKYFNVYGPGEQHKGEMRSLINKAFTQIAQTDEMKLFKSHKPEYGDGEQLRDFVFVEDAVATTLFFHDNPNVSGLFNCGTGKARTWNDLAKAVFKAMHKETHIRYIDMPDTIRDRYQYYTEADMRKLTTAGFNRRFYPIEEGIQKYAKKYFSQNENS